MNTFLASVFSLLQWMFLVYTSASEDGAWLKTPDIKAVCEGDTATLVWSYNNSIGQFMGLVLTKRAPIEQSLVEKRLGEKEQILIDDENSISFHIEYGNVTVASFKMKNVSSLESGQYELDVFLEGKTSYIDDKASLNVISKKDCPDPDRFKHPDLFLPMCLDCDVRLGPNNTLTVPKPANITIGIHMPEAKPPVKCSVTKGSNSYPCMSDPHTTAARITAVFVDGNNVDGILIRLDFVAYEPSFTEIHVKTGEADHPTNGTSDKNSNQGGCSKDSEQPAIVALAVLSGISLLILLIGIGAIIWLKLYWPNTNPDLSRKSRKPRTNKRPMDNLISRS